MNPKTNCKRPLPCPWNVSVLYRVPIADFYSALYPIPTIFSGDPVETKTSTPPSTALQHQKPKVPQPGTTAATSPPPPLPTGTSAAATTSPSRTHRPAHAISGAAAASARANRGHQGRRDSSSVHACLNQVVQPPCGDESRAKLTDRMIGFVESLGNLTPGEYVHLFNLATEEQKWKYLKYLSEFHWHRNLQWREWLRKQSDQDPG